MGKDRLKELVSEQEDVENAEENDKLFHFEDQKVPMEKFLSKVKEFHEMIDEIESNIEEVKKKHRTINVTVTLISQHALDRPREELEDLMENIKKQGNEVKTRLMSFEKRIEETADNFGNADFRIRKTQKAAIYCRFVEVMNEYIRTQVEYRDKYKERIKHQLQLAGVENTDDELEEMIERGKLSVFNERILLDVFAQQTLVEIEARHADIEKLDKSIRDVRDMFSDMSQIYKQGDMIDRVQYNVENTKDYVEHRKIETITAQSYIAKPRQKKHVIIACLAICFLILSLIIYELIKLKFYE